LNPEFLTGSSFKEKRQGQDFYPTPDHATLSLLANETFTGSIWEPACGDGAISKVLLTQYPETYSSDLHDWQYGETGVDFLSSHRRTHNVVTNPPYKLAQEFVEHSLAVSEHKVAMLLKLNFLEGQRRKSMFAKTPLKTVYVFSKRLSFTRAREDSKGNGLLAYAWFVWDKQHSAAPSLAWI
jgi:hypothetical protein